jgi:FimV-like protein
MLKSLLFVYTVFFCFICTIDVLADNSMLGPNVSAQELHAVGDKSSAGTNSTTSDDSAVDEGAQMDNIRAIEAAAKQSANGAAAKQSTNASSVITATGPIANTYQALQTEMSQLGQINAAAVTKLSIRIDGLSQQNQLLEQQVEQLQGELQSVSDGVSNANTTPVSTDFVSLGQLSIWDIVLSALIIILFSMLFRVSRLIAASASKGASDEMEEEYNFMATEEAIPAKLDLARAYIQMEDTAQAAEVLNDILKCGDEEYTSIARELLASLPDATSAVKHAENHE